MLEAGAVLGLDAYVGAPLWRMTPGEVARRLTALRGREEAGERADWHRTAFLACTVLNSQGGKTGGGAYQPEDFLAWLKTGTEAVGARAPLTPENVGARFAAALARVGHPTVGHTAEAPPLTEPHV